METLQVNRKKIEKLSTVLNNSRIKIFEYLVDEDTLVVYNNKPRLFTAIPCEVAEIHVITVF